jgi:hypothetical protein
VADHDDGERWTELEDLYDEATLAALAGAAPVEAGPAPLPARLSGWGRRTAMGMVLTGVALGLQEVFDPPEEHQVVVEVDDEGLPRHLPVEMLLDPDSPTGSLCIVHRDRIPPPTV